MNGYVLMPSWGYSTCCLPPLLVNGRFVRMCKRVSKARSRQASRDIARQGGCVSKLDVAAHLVWSAAQPCPCATGLRGRQLATASCC